MRQVINHPNQLGEILRARRKMRKLPQKALSAKVGLSQSRLSMLEADTAALTIDRLLLLAKQLGLEIVVQDQAEEDATKAEW
jgi:HTH-type transcriptional regulator/antitoxin HipB